MSPAARTRLIRVVVLFGVLVGLLKSVAITVAWWREEIDPGWWAWLWIVLLPVWLFVFLRYFSIFRPGADACLPRDDEHNRPGP